MKKKFFLNLISKISILLCRISIFILPNVFWTQNLCSNWTERFSFMRNVAVCSCLCIALPRNVTQPEGKNTNFIKSYLHFVLIALLLVHRTECTLFWVNSLQLSHSFDWRFFLLSRSISRVIAYQHFNREISKYFRLLNVKSFGYTENFWALCKGLLFASIEFLQKVRKIVWFSFLII